MNSLAPMANVVWSISADERRQHDEQFRTLGPVNGFINGNQAREFFLKSNLPPAVLAQIWDLSDINKDGKMDLREFSIAMHLIKKKLQGVALPSILPDSLKVDAAVTPALPTMPLQPMVSQNAAVQNYAARPWFPPAMSQPNMMQPVFYGNNATASTAMPMAPIHSMAPVQPLAPIQPPNTNVDWTMPQSSRLKFSQQFNSIDKSKTGFLSGAQARGLFGHSDVPSATLAKIWFLADLDKDGKLTVDEFCIASYLIDMVKHGAALPSALPPELAPGNWQRGLHHQRRSSIGSDDLSLSPKGPTSINFESGDIIKAPRMIATFEEKRRQNLERGQAEIERRRQLLQDQENREREQRERKRREERERQEREREEHERRRLLELEKEQARLREEQEKREQEYKRMLEQKEAARREAERQRQFELERQRLLDLRNQRQQEQEAVCHTKQRHKNLAFQVQALTEKANDLNERITEVRSRVLNATDSFETMKAVRDRKLLEIENGKRRVQDLRTKTMQYENEKMQLQSRTRVAGSGSTLSSSSIQDVASACRTGEANLDKKRRFLADVESQIQRKQLVVQNAEKSSTLDQVRRQAAEYRDMVQRVNNILARIRQNRGVVATTNGAQSWRSNNGYGAHSAADTGNTIWYRAAFDFQAENEGELSLRAGDAVLVFIDHPVEEGWLAGQLGDRVGWFPKDFAVPVDEHTPIQETIENRPEIDQSNVATGSARAAATNEVGEWHVAAFAFPASEPGDLGFEIGDKVLVLEKSGDWWTGRIGDRQGIFPSNYVQEASSSNAVENNTLETPAPHPNEHQQLCQRQSKDSSQSPPPPPPPQVVVAETECNDAQNREEAVCEVARAIAQYQAADENQLSLELGDLIKIRSKSPTGWWEGELQKKGEKLRVGWFPGNYVEILNNAAPSRESRSSESGASGEQEVVEALFDYKKQQEDELSFTRGSLIAILEKQDNDWWKGRLEDGQEGLVPTNYIKERSLSIGHRNGDHASDSVRSSAASTPTGELRKRSMYIQELEQTEQNYIDDLQMVVDVFYKQLEVSGLLAPKEVSKLFINWMELATVARSFVNDLRSAGEDRVGSTILKNLDSLKRAFITFCRHQQSALDFLDSKEKSTARFRALHAQCSQHPAARGLQLSYFLLIPLARVTKYHLVVNEILKYTPKDHGDYETLRNSHTALRQLCNEVNEVATETENLQMLYWCQNHVKCESIQPKLVFHSQTNNSGPRRILHSGILYKARSNRLLVALLFNDFLMLTTPDEKIAQPESFKLSRNSEISLSLYKAPISLSKAVLQSIGTTSGGDSDANVDDHAISLVYGEDTVALRAVSSNARILWTKQLEKAIKAAREAGTTRARTVTISSSGIGRLLFEVVFVRDLVVPQDCKGASFYIEFTFGQQKHTKSIDLSRTDTLCTTQMILDSKNGSMKLAIFAERTYSPDICVGRTEMELGAMLKMSGSQRNPAVKQLPLTSDFAAQTETVSGQIIVKFVVQLFDDQ